MTNIAVLIVEVNSRLSRSARQAPRRTRAAAFAATPSNESHVQSVAREVGL